MFLFIIVNHHRKIFTEGAGIENFKENKKFIYEKKWHVQKIQRKKNSDKVGTIFHVHENVLKRETKLNTFVTIQNILEVWNDWNFIKVGRDGGNPSPGLVTASLLRWALVTDSCIISLLRWDWYNFF